LRGHLTGEGFPERQVQVIHNGIYMQAAPGPAARREARRRLGVEPEHVVIGSVGRLDPVKDFPTMVRAFHDVRRVLPQSRLVIIGDGPERPTLGAEIVRLGLTDSVVMTGHREDVASLLPALDIYANSSIFEGVSLTILEAMAAALPVVATRVGGTPEVVLEGETGRLVPARDARIMAKVLLNLASDADTAKRMGANARRRVERHFSIQQMVDRYAAVYRDSRGR
jgi:glycosyltransferase involved in cell wall biosynthesis